MNILVKSSASILIALGLSLSATSAMAADTTSPIYQVKNASGGVISAGAKEFRKGNFKKSITYSNAALKSSLSKRRQAIAQSNLCAAYAELGDFNKAGKACTKALVLRPGYAPAAANKAALTIQLAAIQN
ncbi:MAG: tetratricopeptide repeat protein [Maricaulaceae bacterium]